MIGQSVPLPAIPTDFQELRQANLETLEQLEMNQTALEEFMSKMAIVENYRNAREETETKTRDLADSNVSAYFKLTTVQADVEQAGKDLETARAQVEISFSERDSLMSKFTPKNLLKDLDAIGSTTDSETEKVLADFTSLESAKSAILTQRILHHKAKALADLISSHGSRIVSPRSSNRI